MSKGVAEKGKADMGTEEASKDKSVGKGCHIGEYENL